MKAVSRLKNLVARLYNTFVRKDKKSVFFLPHDNCRFDGYDILNGDSDNVLCLFNDIVRDDKFNSFQLYILVYDKEKITLYQEYCKNFLPERIHFVYWQNKIGCVKSISRCYTVFTDTDYARIEYKVASQRVVCLNYFGGLIKSEFHRWANHGGFKKMLREQKEMYRLFDYHLSISDICSKFIALDNCHYYKHFISLGFPRNDVLFKDHSELRKKIEEVVGFKFKRLIVYAPTHRDYENSEREFFDPSLLKVRSIWGPVRAEELQSLEQTLSETETLIIAKVHPVQQAHSSVISADSSKHVLFFKDLSEKVSTSLNPLLAISDGIITDYTTTFFDFLYLNRPIIYYFYDIDLYRKTRGFFIEPIESICAGHMTRTIAELQAAIKTLGAGDDPYRKKREFLQELFIKDVDNKASERIKSYFFKE